MRCNEHGTNSSDALMLVLFMLIVSHVFVMESLQNLFKVQLQISRFSGCFFSIFLVLIPIFGRLYRYFVASEYFICLFSSAIYLLDWSQNY